MTTERASDDPRDDASVDASTSVAPIAPSAPSDAARIAASLRPSAPSAAATTGGTPALPSVRVDLGALPSPPASAAAAVSEDAAPAPLRNVVGELRASLAMVVAGRFHAPPANAHIRRVFYPLGVVVALWNATMANDELRRRYLRTMVPQVLLTILAALFWVFVINEVRMNLDGLDIQAKGKNVSVTQLAKGGEKAVLSIWAMIVALYTTTSIFEWIVIALTREHHDAMSWHVSTNVGIPPEERIDAPRVRLDVHWLVTKMKRRIQGGIILLVSGLPPSILLLLVIVPFLAATEDALKSIPAAKPALQLFVNALPNVILFVVGAYWLAVFTLGKTAHAWRDEIVVDPFFLRAFDRWADRFPRVCGWLHLYARVLRRALGLVRRPAYVVEHAPWESLGLVLLRVLIALPGVYVLLRPLVPVASTVVIAARSPDTLKGLPVSIVLEERGQ